MKAVIFLQNPWSPQYAGKIWPREYWLLALQRSRSGRRLRVLEKAAGEKLEIWYDNANPRVGATPDSLFPPDLQHMEDVLNRIRPRYVVACGKQAEKGVLKTWSRNTLIVPHPSHRLLTNELYTLAGKLLERGFEGRITLRQGYGHVDMEAKSLAPPYEMNG